MPDAQDQITGISKELIIRNRFCRGVKRGKRYVCSDKVSSLTIINKAVKLLIETANRILRWQVWDIWWIDRYKEEWLTVRKNLEERLKGKYDDDTINAILRLIDKCIRYIDKFRDYWLRNNVGYELKKLIMDLLNGKIEIIVRPNGGISMHGKYVTLEVDQTRTGIMIHLIPKSLRGMTLEIPDIFMMTMNKNEYVKFVNDILNGLRMGLEETDGYTNYGETAMSTAHVWQVIVWALFYPGEVYMLINAININESGVTVKWDLRANNYKSLKGTIFNNAERLNVETLSAFMTTAILGDGSAFIEKNLKKGRIYDEPIISITMSNEEFEAWKPLLERLKKLGYAWSKSSSSSNVTIVRFYDSNAINLARTTINVLPPILRDILDALGFEKWINLKRIAEMKIKYRKGEMQVNVAGYKFTVVSYESTVKLTHWVKDEIETNKVREMLRSVYGDEFVKYIYVNKNGNRHRLVVIPMYVFEKYEDIKEQVVQVLYKKLEKIKDEKKREKIIRVLKKLTSTEEKLRP